MHTSYVSLSCDSQLPPINGLCCTSLEFESWSCNLPIVAAALAATLEEMRLCWRPEKVTAGCALKARCPELQTGAHNMATIREKQVQLHLCKRTLQ